MIPEITAVRVQPHYRLLLRYANGEARLFDATPYLERGIFTRLKEPRLFAQAPRVRHELARIWPNSTKKVFKSMN